MNAIDKSENELVTLNGLDALAVFTTPNAVDPLLAKVRAAIDAFNADISTASGRKAIASMAYRVARAKTHLDDEGKRLADAQKEIPKRIDATRKRIRDTLDQWKDEVRAPLTAWEAEEDARVERINACLDELRAVRDDNQIRPSEVIRERLHEVESEPITKDRYGEHIGLAAELKDQAVTALRSRIVEAETREAEQAELIRLRAEAAEREAKERDDRIAREAAERATREAEAKAAAERKAAEDAAKREREAAERRELELKLAAEQAERRAAEAEARAKRDAEAKSKADAEEAARREADKAHRGLVNKAALDAFVEHGLSPVTARDVVELIARKVIPNVHISY